MNGQARTSGCLFIGAMREAQDGPNYGRVRKDFLPLR